MPVECRAPYHAASTRFRHTGCAGAVGRVTLLPGGSVKRILVILTGGTFGMVPMRPCQTLAPGEVQDHLLHQVPELEGIASIDT